MGVCRKGWRRRIGRIAPAGLLALFWGVKTASLWVHLGERHYAMRGPLADTLHMLWQSWWTSISFTSPHHALLVSEQINHPLGSPNALDYSLAFVHVGLAGLLRGPLGGIAAHNIVAALGLGFSILAVYLFLREISGERIRAAVMTCLVVAAGLCVSNELPDLELVFFAYLPLALLAWTRYLRRGGAWWAAGAMGMAGLTSFTQAYYGVALFAALTMALGMGLAGFPLADDGDPRRGLTRTAYVAGGGLLLSTLLHAHNIANALHASTVMGSDLFFEMTWPFSIWDLLLLLLLVIAPIVLARRLGSRQGVRWALLAAPVLLLSAGHEIRGPWDGVLRLPLYWLREVLPFVWRITYPERFVAPLVLLVGASVLASLRGDPALRLHRLTVPPRLVSAVALVAFWLLATATPLHSMVCVPDPREFSGALSEYPPPGTPVKVIADGPDNLASCGDPNILRVSWRSLTWLFMPLDTMALPPIPPCIAALAADPDDVGVLELSVCDARGYMALFHTAHGKSVAGFPCRDIRQGAQVTTPSQLTRFQETYWARTATMLMAREELNDQGVRYVVRYDLPQCLPKRAPALSEDERAPQPLFSDEDFEASYGAPICADGVSTVYRVDSSSSRDAQHRAPVSNAL